MANRLVSVNEANELPEEVQAQLVGSVEAHFESLTAQAEAAAGSATTAASSASSSAASAENDRILAQAAAASASALNDDAVAPLIPAASGSDTAAAITARIPTVARGVYADRPAANSVTPWSKYVATDVSESYYSDGTAWFLDTGSGARLIYAESLSDFSTASGTAVVVPGMNLTFTVGESPITVDFSATIGQSLGTMTIGGEILFDGVAKVGFGGLIPAGGSTLYRDGSRRFSISGLTPGTTHSVTVTLRAVGGGVATIYGSATALASLEVKNA